MADRPEGSCPQNPLLDMTKRIDFSRMDCTAHGYPSRGGVLIKEVNIVDMQFLQLDRFSAAQRSSNVVQEDEFCARMRKIGAVWWEDKQEWVNVLLRIREKSASESRHLIFGWPTNGEGVWFLKHDNLWELPEDFGKISMAIDMDERCQVMKNYGAKFYADPETLDELTNEL